MNLPYGAGPEGPRQHVEGAAGWDQTHVTIEPTTVTKVVANFSTLKTVDFCFMN
jgi:hypothetical protein